MNDFFATTLLNPDKSLPELMDYGINPSNTNLKPKEDYVDIPQVQQTFKKQDGTFDEDSYNKYYESVLHVYNQFVNDEFTNEVIDTFEYGPNSTAAASIGKREQPGIYLRKISNPTAKTYGLTSVFGESKDQLSYREAAQNNRVWDYENKKWLDWTPNDDDRRGLIDFFFNPKLVMATWEEDGEHEENGRMMKHFKGQYKTDESGNPYYETLGNRDFGNKEMLHLSDTMTIDGSAWNKLDIFDSDGLDKSVTKTVASTIASIVPYFIPYLNTVYKWAQVADGAGIMLSAAGRSAADIAGFEKSKMWQYANNLGAFTESIHSSQTDYAKQHMFGMEGILSIVKDSASQLYSQRMVSKIPGMLGQNPYQKLPKSIVTKYGDEYLAKYGKTLKAAMRDGDISPDFMNYILSNQENIHQFGDKLRRFQTRSRNMGSLYMAGVQTADVYNTMKEHNFNSPEMAAGMIGMYWGYYKLMQSSLGEVAIRGLGLEGPKRITRKFINEITDTIRETTKQTAMNNPQGRFKAIRSIANKVAKYGEKYSANEFFADMVKEGLEEVSEEMLADTWLGLISAADWALSGDQDRNADYNPFDTNILERYGSAFLGGFLGGAVFKGIEKMELSQENRNKAKHGETARELPKEVLNDIVTLVRNGQAQHIITEVEKQMKKGKIAPTQLSMRMSDHANSKEDIAFETATNREESQNDQIGNYIINFVKAIDNIINEEGLAVKDKDVIANAFDRDIRANALMEGGIAKDVLNEFNSILSELVAIKLDEQAMDKNADKSTINQKIKEKKDELNQFIEGTKKADLVERMIFEMNRSVSSNFYSPDIYLYAYSRGKQFNALNAAEQDKLREEFNALTKNTPDYKRVMYNAYKKLKQTIRPHLAAISGNDTGIASLDYLNDLNRLLDDQIETITGDLSEDEKENLLQKIITDIKAQHSDAELEKMLNTRQEADFKLEDALRNKVLNSMEYQQAKYALQMQKMQENIYSNPIANKLGLDQLTTVVLGNVNPDEKITAQGNLLSILYAIQANIYNKIGFLDSQTRNKLKTIINAVYKIDMFNLLSNIDVDKAFNISGNKIHLKNFGFTGDGIINENVTLERDEKTGNYYITGTVKHEENILGEEDVSIIIPNHGTFFINDLNKDNYIKVISSKDGELKIDDFDPIAADSIIEIQYRIPLDPDKQQDTAKELIKKNIDTSIKSYADIDPKDKFLLDYLGGDENYQAFLKTKQVFESMSNHKTNPILQMLSDMSKEMTGLDVLEVFAQEESTYMRSGAVFDYVINNDITKQQLQDAANVINALRSILVSQTKQGDVFDITSILNIAKRKVGIDEDVVLTTDQLSTMLNELAKMSSKIETLLQISEINAGNLIMNSKMTGVNLNCNLLRILIASGPSPINPTYTDKDGNKIGFLRSDILTDDEVDKLNTIQESNDVSEEAYKFTFEMLIKVNKDLHDRYNSLSDEEKVSLRDSLAGNDFFDKSDNKDTNINKYSTTDDLDGDFISRYIYSHCLVDVTEFYSNVYEELLDPNQHAPFAGQLLSMELEYIYALEHELLDEYIDKVKELDKRNVNKISRKNIFFTLGDAGSGKTRLVAAMLKKLLIKKFGPDKKIWYSGPRTETATQLSEVLGNTDPSVVMNKDQLFSNLLTEEGLKKFRELQQKEKNGEYAFDEKDFEDGMFNQDLPDYIFIDEITLFSSLEQKVIESAIKYKNPNTLVFAYGDKYQNQITNNRGIGISCYDSYLNDSPYLNMSVRFNNTTKQDNCIKLLSLLKVVHIKNNDANIKKIPFDATDYYEQLNDIPLKYYEDKDTLHGEKVINVAAFSTEVEILASKLKDGESLAYIYDSTNPRYDQIKNLKNKYGDKIKLIDVNDVQGAEFTYAVIDINFKGVDKNNLTNTFLSELRNLYTLITRSKLGTLIVDNGNLLIKNNIKTSISREVKLAQDELQEYSNFVKNSIPGTKVAAPTPASTTVSEGKSGKNYEQVRDRLKELNVSEAEQSTQEYREKHTRISADLETKGNTDENFNNIDKVNARGIDRSSEYPAAIKVLKAYLLHNNWTQPNLYMSDYVYNSIKVLFQEQSKEKIIEILKQGRAYIKVCKSTDNDFDNRLARVIENGANVPNPKMNAKGTKISKLVFRLTFEGNKHTDLILGYLSEDANIPAVEQAKAQDGDDPKYITFDSKALFNKNSTHIKYRLDRGRMLNGDPFEGYEIFKDQKIQKANSLKQLKAMHPELVFTRTLININPYVDNDSKLLMAPGTQFVLVSSNPNAKPEDLIRRFDAYYLDKNVDVSNIGVLYLTPVGISFTQFSDWWYDLFKNNSKGVAKKKHTTIAGITTASKYSLLIHMLYNRLTGGTRLLEDGSKFLKSIISLDALDNVINQLTTVSEDEKKQGITQDKKKKELAEVIENNFFKYESQFSTSDTDNKVKFQYLNYFSKFKLKNVLNNDEYNEFTTITKGNTELSLNELIDVLTKVKERTFENGKSKYPDSKLEELLDYLIKYRDYDIVRTLEANSSVGNFLQLAELGMIPPLLKSTEFMTNLISKTRSNQTFRDIINALQNNSICFKYGIELAPIDTVNLTQRNSLFNSASSDEDVYVNVMVSTGSVYFANDDLGAVLVTDPDNITPVTPAQTASVNTTTSTNPATNPVTDNMPVVINTNNQPEPVTSNMTLQEIEEVINNVKQALYNFVKNTTNGNDDQVKAINKVLEQAFNINSATNRENLIAAININLKNLIGHACVYNGLIEGAIPGLQLSIDQSIYRFTMKGDYGSNKFIQMFNDIEIKQGTSLRQIDSIADEIYFTSDTTAYVKNGEDIYQLTFDYDQTRININKVDLSDDTKPSDLTDDILKEVRNLEDITINCE